ncbi:hypothetical protein ACFUAG_34710 [Streptomyces sp. NPDC057193]|uniref:hypothetical protein n=1 Tax=Streptomyces sp. NPDC057193 TaxID=3346043 RepID=UPI003631A6D7
MTRRRASRTAAALILPGPAVPIADATAGVAVGDQVAQAANRAAVAAGDIAPDPFTPQPLDAATLTGTPAERLAQVEAALRAADDHAAGSVRAAKTRWTIEKGAALEVLVDQDLYTARGYTSLDAYADQVLHISRDSVYKTIEAAKALRAVLAAPRVSKIFYTPPNASQAKALAPVLALDSGEDKAVEVVTDVQASGKKATAAALTAAAKRLGYTLPRPAPKTGNDQMSEQQRREEAGRRLTAAADLAARALAQYEDALAVGAAPADPERAAADLARLNRIGRTLAKQTRLPGDQATVPA